MYLPEVPRGPIDTFETTLTNAFSPVKSVRAIWVREAPNPGSHRYTRRVWLELSLWIPDDLRLIDRLQAELETRIMHEPFYLQLERVLGTPPLDIAPACVWRRP